MHTESQGTPPVRDSVDGNTQLSTKKNRQRQVSETTGAVIPAVLCGDYGRRRDKTADSQVQQFRLYRRHIPVPGYCKYPAI